MSASILDGTKKALGVHADYDVFDPDIIMHINTVFSTLHQLGIGPIEGFFIEDAAPTWTDFLGGTDARLNSVKSYMYLKVRMLFDPPTTSYLINAMKEQAEEIEWRLNVVREGDVWVPPILLEPNPLILDGGDAT